MNLLIRFFHLGAYCDRSFKTTIQLTNHVNTHLGVKPFQVKDDSLSIHSIKEIFFSANFVHSHLQQVVNLSDMFDISKQF